jgi:hypothetical protein
MYRKIENIPTPIGKFELPFEGQLAEDNRWVIMANLIPWSEFEDEYAQKFTIEMGAPAKSFRTAIGALIIKERLGLSDRETVEQIRENPYLQYFIGLNKYSNEAPFEASILVHFRQRIDIGLVNRMNRSMVKNSREEESEEATAKKLLAVLVEKKKMKK